MTQTAIQSMSLTWSSADLVLYWTPTSIYHEPLKLPISSGLEKRAIEE